MPIKRFLLHVLFVICSSQAISQVVTVTPLLPKSTDVITISFDASAGSAGLKGTTTSVYFHSGLVTSNSTSLTDWKYAKGNWGADDGLGKMTNAGTDKWTITIPMSTYYGTIQAGETIQHVSCVFRNADGTKTGKNTDGSNIIIDINTTSTNNSNLPAGVSDGINYLSPTSVILCLYAPFKNNVYVKGDFNNWQITNSGLMNRTTDGLRYWIQLDNLTPGKEYAYQYYVDGYLTIADPYCDKVLDPWNDQYISSSVYPRLIPYPNGKTDGIVSVFQTGQVAYKWTNTNFKTPAVADLVVYELLVRDFIQSHNYKALADTLDYLKVLGINALELMPVMEFENNQSWGYDASFMFAPDKYYGTKNDLKLLIDKAHEKGIAVILDIVLNQQFGQSPLVQLYWNSGNNTPASNSPWFNQYATHPYSVGYDMNHESQATKDFVDRVNTYWLEEYKVDGFRFDLSKGFTQKNCGNDVSCWNAYDQSRVDLLKRMYDKIKTVNPSAYVILEHLGDNTEETVLANYGMIPWGKATEQFTQNATGFNTNCDISWTYYKKRGWANPNGITYMESHDEERLMYSNYQSGNSNGSYNVKNFKTALSRMKGIGAFFFLVTGPKMIYQFGELGYDIGVNTIGGHTGNKPIRWDYYSDADRFSLYQTWAQIIHLKHTYPLFQKNIADAPQYMFNGLVKRFKITDATMNVVVVGNFDVIAQSVIPDFDITGTWYDYLSGGAALEVTNTGVSYLLQPGEFHIWTSKKINLPAIPKFTDLVTDVKNSEFDNTENTTKLICYPNPSNSDINISYISNADSKTKITISDIVGREVKVIYDGFLNKGTTLFGWDAKNNNGAAMEGIYFIRMESNNKIVTEKVVLFH